MLMPEKPSFHKPEITRHPESGIAHVDGTRIPVWLVVVGIKREKSLDQARNQFVYDYPFLTPAHFNSAYVFYQSNNHEIEQDIKEYRRQVKLARKHSDPITGIINSEALGRALASSSFPI